MSLSVVFAFFLTRADWDPMHAWNRAFGDASLVLLLVALASGPLARLWPPAARLLRSRREIGVWSVLAALGHVLIVMTGWVQWDVVRLFNSYNVFKRDWALDQGFAIGNLLGLVALAYGLVLLATSNDASIRFLGGSAWKFVQQGAYVYYALVMLHVAYFLFMHFVSFHRLMPAPNWLQTPFLFATMVVLVLQAAAFTVTVCRRRSRG